MTTIANHVVSVEAETCCIVITKLSVTRLSRQPFEESPQGTKAAMQGGFAQRFTGLLVGLGREVFLERHRLFGAEGLKGRVPSMSLIGVDLDRAPCFQALRFP